MPKPPSPYRNPVPTVDIIIYDQQQGVVLIKRKNPPYGWAIPGGFIDYGEQAELAAVREAKEETSLDVILTALLGVYSAPNRDPRQHTISIVYVATSCNLKALKGADDAAEAAFFPLDALPSPMAFDHAAILEDLIKRLAAGTLQAL